MSEERLTSRQRIVLILILFLALIIRLWAVAACRFIGTDGGVDGVGLLTAGRNLFSGAGFVFQGRPETIHAPLFPILAGLIWRVVGDLELAGLLVSALSGVVAVGAVYLLGRPLFGRAPAIYGSALAAVFPPFIYAATEVRVDTLYAALYLLLAAALWRAARRPDFIRGATAGTAIGLAYLTRPEGLIFLPLGAAAIFLKAGRGWKKQGRRLAAAGAGMLLIFALLALPYLSFLQRHLGDWTLSARSPFTFIPYFAEDWEEANFQAYAYPERVRAEWARRDGLPGVLWEERGKLARRFFHNLAVLFTIGRSEEFARMGLPSRPVSWTFAFLVIVFGGLLARKLAARRWSFRDSFILLLCLPAVPYFFLTDFLTSQKLRYGYPYLAWLLLLAGAFLARRQVHFLRHLSAGILLGGSLLVSICLIPRKVNLVPYEFKSIGLWMRDNLEGIEEATVMSQRLGVPFYAGARHVQIPPGTWPEILDYARRTGADYLAVDDWTTTRLRPGAAFLLESGPVPPQLDRVHGVTHRRRRALLYRFLPDED